MKKFILLTAMFFIALAATAQGRYYTLVECGTDPLRYIEKNYEDNKARYNGKTIAEFVQECELTIEDFVPRLYLKGEGGYDPNMRKVSGIYFDFYFDTYMYTVGMTFKPPYTYSKDDLRRISSTTIDEPWQDKFYQFRYYCRLE